MPRASAAIQRCTINIERKAQIIKVVLMVASFAPGVVLLVFFSLPYAQANDYLRLVAPDEVAAKMTSALFSNISQSMRILGALLLAVGLGLLTMPVRTQHWIERLVRWFERQDKNASRTG